MDEAEMSAMTEDEMLEANEKLMEEVMLLQTVMAEALPQADLAAARERVLNAELKAYREVLRKELKEVKPVAAIDHSAAQHVGNAISAMLARSAEKKSADAKFASLGKENARAAAMRELVFEPAAAYKDPRIHTIVQTCGLTVADLQKLNKNIQKEASFGMMPLATFKRIFIGISVGDSDECDRHLEVVEDLLDSAKTGNIQGCGYAAMLAFAVQGDEADKLGSLFTIFDTSNKGKLEQRTLKVLSGAVSFISQNFSNDSGGLDMSTANAPAVSADEFVGFCTSNDAVTKIIQRAFLAILKVPPKSSGVASQYAQQATLARRRVDSLRTKKARTEEERARKELDSLKRKMTEKERELMRAASLVEIEESRDENSTDGADGAPKRKPSFKGVASGVLTGVRIQDAIDLNNFAGDLFGQMTAAKPDTDMMDAIQRVPSLAMAPGEEDVGSGVPPASVVTTEPTAARSTTPRPEKHNLQRSGSTRSVTTVQPTGFEAQEANAKRWQNESVSVEKAKEDTELASWMEDQAPNTDDQERLRKIEEAERAAISEVVTGSNMSNDDAILRAMAATNPAAFQATLGRRKSGSGSMIPEPSGASSFSMIPERAPASASMIPEPASPASDEYIGIGNEPTSPGVPDGRIIMPDADYLLSMIMIGVDEATELKDAKGRRYHNNASGVPVYREADVAAVPFGAPVNPQLNAVQDDFSASLSRRAQAASEVERRKAEVQARRDEASKRSLNRQGGLAGFSSVRATKNSETAF